MYLEYLVPSIVLNIVLLAAIPVVNRKRIRKRCKRMIKKSVSAYRRLGNRLFVLIGGALPIDSNLAVFSSYRGMNFSGSPKYILKELQSRNTGIRAVVELVDPSVPLEGIRCKKVRRMSFRYHYCLMRAKYLVNNVNFPDFLPKREGSVHIQTMHGTPLKYMGSDIIKIPSKAHTIDLLGLYRRSKRWDVLVSPNAHTTEVFSRVFKYRGRVLESGYPRNDILVNEANNDIRKAQLRRSLGIPEDRQVILYAPTWRDYSDSKTVKTAKEFGLDIAKLREHFGDTHVFLFRVHHLLVNSLKFDEADRCVLNVSQHDDIQELCLASDALITDYSSIMFDYAVLGRPMFFYVPDYDKYMASRGTYIELKDIAPGPVVTDMSELVQALMDMTTVTYQFKEQYAVFRKRFCAYEKGTASKQIVDEFFVPGEDTR